LIKFYKKYDVNGKQERERIRRDTSIK